MRAMGFLDRIFGYKKAQMHTENEKLRKTESDEVQNENVLKLIELKSFMDSLMNVDKYIAKSDYIQKM